MLIFKNGITLLASEGRLTLQVPDMAYGCSSLEGEEVPNDWIMQIRGGQHIPCVGKEQGFLFLTRKGWEANKDKIKAAFEASKDKRGTWQEFEAMAEKHFIQVQKKLNSLIQRLEAKVKEAKAIIV
jgi:hypothetical protein